MQPCETCRSRAVVLLAGTKGGDYMCCRSCKGEVQVIDDKGQLSTRFGNAQEEYYGHDSVYLLPIFDKLGARAARYRIAIVQRHLRQGHILEVGPGMGHFLSLAIQKGFSCEAAEHSVVLAEAIAKRCSIPVHVGAFEQLDLRKDHFDAYASFHVIEHSPDPVGHLRAARRLVRSGGYMILATPNATGAEHRLLSRHSPNYSVAHLRVFSPRSLAAVCEQSGWDVVATYTRARSEDWVRVLTAIARLLRQANDRPQTSGSEGGSFVRKMPKGLGSCAFQVFAALSWIPRRAQARLGLGNELIVVARRLEPTGALD